MKKFLILLGIIALSLSAHAKGGPFQLNKDDLNIGLGIGSTLYGDETIIPPISASYEVGFPWEKNDFTKNMSIGGYLGFSQTGYDWYWGKWTYTYIILGARASYHFYNKDNIDAYGGLMIGYNIVSDKFESKVGYDDYYSDAGTSSGLEFSAFAGARYYFNDSFGIFGELGYGIAYLNIGVTLKL